MDGPRAIHEVETREEGRALMGELLEEVGTSRFRRLAPMRRWSACVPTGPMTFLSPASDCRVRTAANLRRWRARNAGPSGSVRHRLWANATVRGRFLDVGMGMINKPFALAELAAKTGEIVRRATRDPGLGPEALTGER